MKNAANRNVPLAQKVTVGEAAANGTFVRSADLRAKRSEGPLTAISAKMYMPQLGQFWFIDAVRDDWYQCLHLFQLFLPKK